uniref:endonuclease domain-containing protein n=1 Tax=Parerythrobacter lutipelagi TaxID=1964208 RepID=UPI0010F7A03D|nr:DUF559 domain-containing protein [Parerythrobacter lutipelagi]
MRDIELRNRARKMRSEMTEPETRLWLELRAKRFKGIKFRRQKVIQDDNHRYIVDFSANEPKVVIELDGDAHSSQQQYDAQRTHFLESKGYTVIRFANHDVLTNLDGVLDQLGKVIDTLQSCAPLPTLSPEGERAL